MANGDDVELSTPGPGSVPVPVSVTAKEQGTRRRFVDTRLFQFGLFAANGGAVAVVYSIAVWSFIALSPDTFALDVVVAYAIAAVANYTGARLIFKPVTTPRAHLPRYLTVLAGNFLLTAALAWLLHRVGLPTVVSAYAPVVITAVPTFLLMRKWVFYSEPDADGSADTQLVHPEVQIPLV